MKRCLITLLLLVFFGLLLMVLPGAAQVDHVLIISVDGLRPDALHQARMPHLDALWQNGAYSWRAQTTRPSATLPSHASMLSGVGPGKHGITWNSWQPGRGTIRVTTVFEVAHQAGLKTAMVVGKEKLRHLNRPGSVDYFRYPGYGASQVGPAAAQLLRAARPHLTFVHFSDPDGAGHRYGWMSRRQIASVEAVDAQIGNLLRALRAVGLFDRTLILVTADHGGHGTGHGTADPRDRTIPWIAHGPGVRRNYKIQQAITTCDTAATAAYALGLRIPPSWQGHPVREAFSQNVPLRAGVRGD
jgi:predicted AlkP superfamily pyrophosphatase or phosphodiesterase